MTQPRVITEIEGPVARVWLNRPDKLNGLDLDTVDQLAAAARSLRSNRTVRVVVIEGKGDSFCAGLDFAAAGKESKLRILRFALPNILRGTNAFQECFWAWRNLPMPVIAVTRGHVFGGGIQLALACDFRFSTPDCQWSVLEAKWGLIPDMSGTIPLVELVGADVAKRLTMTGEIISGEQAHASREHETQSRRFGDHEVTGGGRELQRRVTKDRRRPEAGQPVVRERP